MRTAAKPPSFDASVDCPIWKAADVSEVNWFHPKSPSHHPVTRARVLHDRERLYVRFDVQDQFVRSVQTEYQSRVSGDSCVEFFLQPDPAQGYFAFEMNCGGTMALFYIEDPTRMPDRFFRKSTVVPADVGGRTRIVSTMPKVVEPEIQTSMDWSVMCEVPLSILEHYVGTVNVNDGSTWRGNFFKCGDQTSHPHWASWSPFAETLRFHQPDRFGTLRFTK